jgi:hypothetical protein
MNLLAVLLLVISATKTSSIQPLTTVPYSNAEIAVYDARTFDKEHNRSTAVTGKKGLFYTDPLALVLLNQTQFDVTTQFLRFQLVLFNEDLRRTVINYLVDNGYSNSSNQTEVKLVPIDKLRVSWTKEKKKTSNIDFHLETSFWLSLQRRHQLDITLSCNKEESCKDLYNNAKKFNNVSSEISDSLQLEYVYESTNIQRMQVHIDIKAGEHVINTAFYQNLVEQVPTEPRYFFENDLDEFMKEILDGTLLSEQFVAADPILSPGDEEKLEKLLKFSLVTLRMKLDNWSNIYWPDEDDEDKTRPDRALMKLNEELKAMNLDEEDEDTTSITTEMNKFAKEHLSSTSYDLFSKVKKFLELEENGRRFKLRKLKAYKLKNFNESTLLVSRKVIMLSRKEYKQNVPIQWLATTTPTEVKKLQLTEYKELKAEVQKLSEQLGMWVLRKLPKVIRLESLF